MRLKLDENIPVDLVDALCALGHDVDTVPQERLTGAADIEVWNAARKEARCIVTQDLDFSDIRAVESAVHHGVLLVRLNNASRRNLIERITAIFRDESVESWVGCLVVVTERKIRIRRPGQ